MIREFADWLGNTQISRLFADLSWFVPAVQTIHILGIAVVVTLLGMLNVRVLRITAGGPAAASLAKTYIPLVWRALAVLLLTGIMLTIAEPARELMNIVFRLKMALVVALVMLTFTLGALLRRHPDYWSVSRKRRVIGTSIAAGSLILCICIVAAGRLIAYV